MLYTYTEHPDNELLSEGEILVENEEKGIWQIVGNLARPYNLIYLPSNNNVYGTRELKDFDGQDIEFIKVVT